DELAFFYFFQAEVGIRDFHVTGVQTCALPICSPRGRPAGARAHAAPRGPDGPAGDGRGVRRRPLWRPRLRAPRRAPHPPTPDPRSEERRVGGKGSASGAERNVSKKNCIT